MAKYYHTYSTAATARRDDNDNTGCFGSPFSSPTAHRGMACDTIHVSGRRKAPPVRHIYMNTEDGRRSASAVRSMWRRSFRSVSPWRGGAGLEENRVTLIVAGATGKSACGQRGGGKREKERERENDTLRGPPRPTTARLPSAFYGSRPSQPHSHGANHPAKHHVRRDWQSGTEAAPLTHAEKYAGEKDSDERGHGEVSVSDHGPEINQVGSAWAAATKVRLAIVTPRGPHCKRWDMERKRGRRRCARVTLPESRQRADRLSYVLPNTWEYVCTRIAAWSRGRKSASPICGGQLAPTCWFTKINAVCSEIFALD